MKTHLTARQLTTFHAIAESVLIEIAPDELPLLKPSLDQLRVAGWELDSLADSEGHEAVAFGGANELVLLITPLLGFLAHAAIAATVDTGKAAVAALGKRAGEEVATLGLDRLHRLLAASNSKEVPGALAAALKDQLLSQGFPPVTADQAEKALLTVFQKKPELLPGLLPSASRNHEG